MLSHEVDGLAIRRERERQGIKVPALAQAAGISADYLYKIEVGARQPGHEAANAIATALGTKLDHFLVPTLETV